MRKFGAALAIALMGSTSTPSTATASSGDPTRVLIVGDSVTHGASGDYTWRYFSWNGLAQTGASVDFVGPYSGTFSEDDGTWGGTYADPGFDSDHAARWGLAMDEPWSWPSPNAPLIGDLVAESQPDVVVEQLGVNDFAWLGLSSEDMLESVRRFVEEARAAKPDVDVVLGTIAQTWIREVESFNASLPGLASELTTEDSHVVSTPLADFTYGADTYDPAHPTTLGQRKIAHSVSVGLEALGVGREVLMPSPATPGPRDPVEPEPEPEQEPQPEPGTEPETQPETQPELELGPQPEPHPEPAPEAFPLEVITPPEEVDIPEPVVGSPLSATPPPAAVTPVPARTTPPTAPRGVRAVRTSARHALVSWRAVDAAERYVVRCGTRRTVATTTSTMLRTASARCQVRAIGATGRSEWTAARVRRR